jgi:hypothetical protein
MNTVADVFNQSVDYIKGIKIPSVSDYIPVWFKSKSKSVDSSQVDLSQIHIQGEPFDSTDNIETINDAMGNDVNPLLKFIINIILIVLYYIFIFILASIVANDFIRSHWLIRLYAFVFVLILCYYTSIGVYPISIYYSITALYNVYRNYRDRPIDSEALKLWHPLPILPQRYCFLPLMTTRSKGILDMLNPFSYFSKGEDPMDPVYANYTYESKTYKANLNEIIPGFAELKGMYLGTLLKKFTRFFYELNQSYMKKVSQDQEEEVPEPDDLNLKDVLKGAIAGATDNPIEFVQKTLGPTGLLIPTATATAKPT